MFRRIGQAVFFLILFYSCNIYAQTGIFVNLEGGWSKQSGLPSAHEIGANKVETKNFPAVRFGLGYIHDFNDVFGAGLEVGHGFYSKSKYRFTNSNKLDATSNITDFLGVFIFHKNKFDFFAKLGGNRHEIDISSNMNFRKETDIQPEIIAGLNYTLIPHLAVTLNYLHAFGHGGKKIKPNDCWKAPSLDAVMAGFWVTFF